MKTQRRLAGRFQPWRVYYRWKLVVRLGLFALPLVLLLSGGIQWYLQTPRYRSTTVFGVRGDRPLPAMAALLHSGNVVEIAIRKLRLQELMKTDLDAAAAIVSSNMETTVDAAAETISLSVALARGDWARDLAAALPAALETYETSVAAAALERRIDAEESAAGALEDDAAEKHAALVRLIDLRGPAPASEISKLDVDEAKTSWEHAERAVLDERARIAAGRRELAHPARVVVVHSQPARSYTPVPRDWKNSLGAVFLRAIGAGLAVALAAPYLLELAFPRRRRTPPFQPPPWECDSAGNADDWCEKRA